MSTLVDEKVPYPRRIFCNRNLRLDRIKYIGFDMDYTLAAYNEQIEHLQASMVLERLVSEYGYGREILQATYDPDFAIRGLTVDLVRGNVLKMDRHRFVGRVWHGKGFLDPEIRRETYTNHKVSPKDERYVMVDTLYSLPEISLYCQLVSHFDKEDSGPTYVRIWTDLRSAMDSLHRDGTLKAVIRSDLEKYLVKDDALQETLHRFRSAGKKLFILTNSEPDYTHALMSFLLDDPYGGYCGWQDYFDFVLTSTRKPAFFTSEEPFFLVDEDFHVTDVPASKLRRGELVSGGNFLDLARLTGMMGEEVLYVGDHIYGDILRSKIHTHWRTAMIVQEMDRELAQTLANKDALNEVQALEQQRFQLNLELAARALDGDKDRALRAEARELTFQIVALEKDIADSFNPNWGMLFRDRTEPSAFGEQVDDYACVYTGRVTNFRLYSPQWYFRSPRGRMAHEIAI